MKDQITLSLPKIFKKKYVTIVDIECSLFRMGYVCPECRYFHAEGTDAYCFATNKEYCKRCGFYNCNAKYSDVAAREITKETTEARKPWWGLGFVTLVRDHKVEKATQVTGEDLPFNMCRKPHEHRLGNAIGADCDCPKY